ncbi:aminoacyl-histidine dipeptidase [Pokkaliibacter sp. CJK22405]|uniref:aminoacyl-histidine dipeptidase n=1 Tax=Pokkaliibacter sp. CJK22405 TaxID=3384615 RepID=UPI003984DA95
MTILHDLSPSLLWKHFQMLCNTPRPSGYEAALREKLIRWAEERGLTCETDDAGNLLIRKAATAGMEDRASICLQGHLDMVAQQNEGTNHDFVCDPIRPRIIDGWVHASDTTLGADNGMGVAAALAVLESTEIAHGPIEALFTIEEETSMRGALELKAGWLRSDLLLNLDSEDRGEVYVGCAGGADVNVHRNFLESSIPQGWTVQQVEVKGLRGGHSGLDIHKGLGNANQLLVRLLIALGEQTGFSLVNFHGGTLRNALPREASARIALPESSLASLSHLCQTLAAQYQQELSSVDANVHITQLPAEGSAGLSEDDTRTLLNALFAAPHGVERMSADVPGVVETSNNLGVVNLASGNFSACLLVRSLRDASTRTLADRIKALFSLAGCTVTSDNGYPGWTPNPASPLLQRFQAVHAARFGHEAAVKVIHAGLECGIIGAIYPQMDMVSFGPIIRGAHSPNERVEISSVAAFWDLLVALLADAPKAA